MNMHLHIDADILIDWTNELLPESEKDYSETQANLIDFLTEFAEDPNQCSEEPKVVFDSAQEGKPRCIIPLFYALYSSNYLYML